MMRRWTGWLWIVGFCYGVTAEVEQISRPSDFAVMNEVLPYALFEIRYFEENNFVGSPVDGYKEPLCFLTKKAGVALEKVYQEAKSRGYTLKIFDCYRPQRAVDHFVRWAKDLKDQKMKSKYYPNEDKSVLFEKGYIAEKSGHSRGSTLDLTLAVPVSDDERKRSVWELVKSFFTMDDYLYSAKELDMGTSYDFFDSLSHTADPRITKKQKQNRFLLKELMEKHGFVNYDKEWWHYTLKDEPYKDTYFNFPVALRASAI